MARFLIGTLLALGIAAQGRAVSLTVGYANIPASMSYYSIDDRNPFYNSTANTQSFNVGVVTVGGESIVAMNEMFGIGIEVGASMPGAYTFDETKRRTPDYGDPNPFTDDTTKLTFMQVPLLARAEAKMPMEMAEFTLGFGAGVVLLPWTSEFHNQLWTDMLMTGSGPNKTTTRFLPHGVFTVWDSGMVGVPMFELVPGLHMKMGEKTTVGIEVPLMISPKTKVRGSQQELEIPEPFVSNPDIWADVWEVGGFSWAARLAITRVL